MTFQFLQRHGGFDAGSEHLFSPLRDGLFEIKHMIHSFSRASPRGFFPRGSSDPPDQTKKSPARRTSGPKQCRPILPEGKLVAWQDEAVKQPDPNNAQHARSEE